MRFVFEWMFGISVAVIFPMALLVIYTTRNSIKKVIMRLEQRIFNWKWFHDYRWERQRKVLKKQWEEKDGDYSSSSGITDEKEQAQKRVPFWRRQVIPVTEVVVDAEKGVNGKSVG
jgi:hypothetical protein